MAMAPTREHAELRVVLDNSRPVDVTDLGRSLEALGREYEEFVVGRFEPPPVNARLYVSHVESGTIIVTLETLLDQASFLLKHVDVFAGFITNIQDIINLLLHLDKAPKPDTITNASVERILVSRPAVILKMSSCTLHQMRGDPKAKTGDRGIIEKFSTKPVKLHFMSPSVKASILDQPENPFKMAYVVDGEVSTVNGEPGLYKIYEVHDAIEKP